MLRKNRLEIRKKHQKIHDFRSVLTGPNSTLRSYGVDQIVIPKDTWPEILIMLSKDAKWWICED